MAESSIPFYHPNPQGFGLKWESGSCTSFSMTTLKELQDQLTLKDMKWSPRVLVLPGYLYEESIEMLSCYGIADDVLHEFEDGTVYRPRGRRPQDAVVTYSWKVPKVACCCGACHVGIEYGSLEYVNCNQDRRSAMLLGVSLWLESSISVLLSQEPRCPCAETASSIAFESELREKLPKAGLNISIEDYVNQLAYERWVEFVAELRFDQTSNSLMWAAVAAVEQNLDQARYMAACGKAVYVANVQAWDDILRRLERRWSSSKP